VIVRCSPASDPGGAALFDASVLQDQQSQTPGH
jgi:hypothetical protein